MHTASSQTTVLSTQAHTIDVNHTCVTDDVHGVVLSNASNMEFKVLK